MIITVALRVVAALLSPHLLLTSVGGSPSRFRHILRERGHVSMLLVHLDEGAEVRGHFDNPLRLLHYPRGQAGERGVLDGVDRVEPALIAQQHLEGPAVLVDRV